MKYPIIVFVVILLVGTASASEQLRPYPLRNQFLTMSPSVRANGMGEAGVTLIDDYSVFFNPGSIGLLHVDERVRFNITPGYNKTYSAPGLEQVLKLRYWFLSIDLLNRNNNPVGFTISAYRKTYSSSVIFESQYYDGSTVINEIDDYIRTQGISIGIGIDRKVQIGVGATLKIFCEDNEQDDKRYRDIDSHGYDFGGIIRFPFKGSFAKNEKPGNLQWKIIPAIALSINNYSPEIDSIEITGSYDPWNRIYEEIPAWPETRRWGMSVAFEMHRQTSYGTMKAVSLMPVYEIETLVQRVPHPSSRHKRGIEITAMDALCARFGKARIDGITRKNTWGLSVNSRGIARLFASMFSSHNGQSQGSLSKFLQERLQVEFSFARVSTRLWSSSDHEQDYWDTNYYGISVRL